MKRIAILSDTHGFLPPRARDYLDEADLFLHAGDLDNPSIALLLDFYQGYIARGNNDFFGNLPDTVRVTIEGVRFLMVHNKSHLRPTPTSDDADVVIYGHTHVYDATERLGVLWLNPGSCARPRFGDQRSMVIMEVDNGTYSFKRVTV